MIIAIYQSFHITGFNLLTGKHLFYWWKLQDGPLVVVTHKLFLHNA